MKKRSDILSKELILLSIRVNSLKAEKRQIAGNIISMQKVLKNYKSAERAIKYLNEASTEIDMEIYRRNKRMRKIAAELFKRSGKTFRESPKDIRPGTIDLINGYIELTEIREDTLIENVLILNTGQIFESDSQEARALLHESYLDEREFNRLRSYLILTNEINYMKNFSNISIERDANGKAIAILENDHNHKINKLKKVV